MIVNKAIKSDSIKNSRKNIPNFDELIIKVDV